MDDFSSILNQVLDFLRQGFNDVNNQIIGIVIAVIAAFMLSSWRRLWALALGATVAHVVISNLLLPLIQGAGFHLPPNLMEKSFWIGVAALYVGYFIVIAVFFFLKKTLLKGGAATAH